MRRGNFSIRFPESETGIQSENEEFCILEQGGQEKSIRFHDYHKIYKLPGLYEYLFCEKLGYRSPEVITSLLIEQVNKSSIPISDLSVFDVGAGNGIVGAALKERGIEYVFGIDIVREAAEAAQRDRPGVYNQYYVEDLENLSKEARRDLESKCFNCLVSVGALGFGDIPPVAFAKAYNLIADEGWIAFNINEGFIKGDDTTGFSSLIRQMIDKGILIVKVRNRYCHRLSVAGKRLHYVAVVGNKQSPIPENWL
jgi:predicted TPR repeat methyltransferase